MTICFVCKDRSQIYASWCFESISILESVTWKKIRYMLGVGDAMRTIQSYSVSHPSFPVVKCLRGQMKNSEKRDFFFLFVRFDVLIVSWIPANRLTPKSCKKKLRCSCFATTNISATLISKSEEKKAGGILNWTLYGGGRNEVKKIMRWSLWNKTSKRNWNSLSGRISGKYTAKQKGEKTNNGAERGRDSQQFSFLWKSDLAEIDLGKRFCPATMWVFCRMRLWDIRKGQWHRT